MNTPPNTAGATRSDPAGRGDRPMSAIGTKAAAVNRYRIEANSKGGAPATIPARITGYAEPQRMPRRTTRARPEPARPGTTRSHEPGGALSDIPSGEGGPAGERSTGWSRRAPAAGPGY